MSVRYALKWLLAQALYRSGILHLWKRIALRNRAVVLMYHRVLDDHARSLTWSNTGIIVSRATFERHIDFLRQHFAMLSLDEFSARLAGQAPFETASCLVTFDDGWRDTYEEAWPVLNRAKVPGVVFLPSDFMGTGKRFWQEELKRLLFTINVRARRDKDFAAVASPRLRELGFDALLRVPEDELRPAVMAAVEARKYSDYGTSESTVKTLQALHGSTERDDTDSFMSWEMAREMRRDGIAFGAHSATHRLMTSLDDGEVQEEIVRSRDSLQNELGAAPVAFSYPNGNWSDAIARRVEGSGFGVAFSTERGLVDAQSNRFAVKRINVHEDATSSVAMFYARLVGVI